METGTRRGPLIAILVIGIGLAAAPAMFQMFTRAPMGGDMINDFRPFMEQEVIDNFQGYMALIRAADAETREVIEPALVDSGILTQADYDSMFGLVGTLNEKWPAIDADMSDLLDTMDTNLDNFGAVDALPPFALFPWFFLLPGLMIAAVAIAALRSARTTHPTRLIRAAGILGIAVIMAPAIFQMFTRAPLGGDMINDFRPMMTRERVQGVQGYFVVLGGAEGRMRNALVPFALDEGGLSDGEVAAANQFSADWVELLGEFAPMISTMSNNVENFQAVDALPPFPLFPWFFVVPGVLVAGFAWRARNPDSTDPDGPIGDENVQ